MNIICTIMKGKMLMLLAIACGFTSCLNEEPIGPSGHDGEAITITASLSVDAIQTKADALTETDTTQEKTLNNTLVMVFQKDGFGKLEDCTGWATGSGNAAVPVKTKIGPAIIIAVANIEEDLLIFLKRKYDAGTLKYSDMAGVFTNQQLIDPNNLVKVREMEVELTHAKHAGTALSIELIQLPARIDVKIEITDASGGKWEFEPLRYDVANIRSASDIILIEGGTPPRLSNEQKATTPLSAQDATKGISFYTYEKETSSEPVIVKISGKLKNLDKGTSVDKTYTLPIDPIADGAASKTTGIAHGYAHLVKGKIDARIPGVTIEVLVVPMQKWPVNVDYGKDETWD